jgi:hypothetical protein
MFTAKRSVMLFGRVFGIKLIVYVEDVIDFAKKPWAEPPRIWIPKALFRSLSLDYDIPVFLLCVSENNEL